MVKTAFENFAIFKHFGFFYPVVLAFSQTFAFLAFFRFNWFDTRDLKLADKIAPPLVGGGVTF
jgi:hypothetical protein